MQSLSAMPLMIVNHNILSWIIQPILYIVCMYITVSVWKSFVLLRWEAVFVISIMIEPKHHRAVISPKVNLHHDKQNQSQKSNNERKSTRVCK